MITSCIQTGRFQCQVRRRRLYAGIISSSRLKRCTLFPGNFVPDIKNLLALVEKSHFDLCPGERDLLSASRLVRCCGRCFAHLKVACFVFLGAGVPFAGWDVVLSADPDLPVCLLEVNLSCNFFRGSFDKKLYLDFIDDAFASLQSKRLVADLK
jgi:hypothetical protein